MAIRNNKRGGRSWGRNNIPRWAKIRDENKRVGKREI
jgi:hypothetical protein